MRYEFSDSYTFNLEQDWYRSKSAFGFSVNAFHTSLRNTFIYEEVEDSDLNGVLIQKNNGPTARVSGLSMELRLQADDLLGLNLGYTVQQSHYSEAIYWSAEMPGTRQFLRTPNQYGYATLGFFRDKALQADVNVIYTGSMRIPHFGGAEYQAEDELHTSAQFLELGFQLRYRIEQKLGLKNINLGLGVLNLFNQYQNDFDRGPLRDSNYVYGPAQPRSLQFSIALNW